MVDNKIHLIGSEGFIGKSIQKISINQELVNWSHSSKENYFNIFENSSWSRILDMKPQRIIFLSWPGLPNYDSDFHLTHNLPAIVNFFESIIYSGVKRIVFTGTCYEYGNKSGMLSELDIPEPICKYGISKNLLRLFIQNLCENNSISWAWTRIFYPYGNLQKSYSLYPSLLKSIKEKKDFFKISSSSKKRDFINVDDVAKYLLLLSNSKENGIFNIGSGKPQLVKEFVERIIKENKSNIKIIKDPRLNRENEPNDFWADVRKINNLRN
jgi:dTDP-6-deoxy-L-talose 4-dehydrogenase (NAD+)